jgi:hypothetical protein
MKHKAAKNRNDILNRNVKGLKKWLFPVFISGILTEDTSGKVQPLFDL